MLSEKGRNISDETRRKRSDALKGRKIPQHQREIISALRKGKSTKHQFTPDVCAKISAANKGNKFASGCKRSEETRAKMSAAQRLVVKPVEVSDSIVREIRALYFGGGIEQRQIAGKFGVSTGFVSKVIRGHVRPEAGGPIYSGPKKKKALPLADAKAGLRQDRESVCC